MPAQVAHFYTSCYNCDEWIDFRRDYGTTRIIDEFDMTHRKVRHQRDMLAEEIGALEATIVRAKVLGVDIPQGDV